MRFYEDPQKTSENRLPQRSYYIPENPGAYISLNGTWRFRFFERDMDLTEEIDRWDRIDVPSCWQARGYEEPNYTNVNFPFPADPPYVPDDNPCGVYEREFQLTNPQNKTYFVFEGVASVGVLYINGRYVGFTSGNHLQSEFDITDFVTEGTNTVRVVVHKWACTSYLEDQDFFRFNGIFRDVYLLSRPKDHIGDIDITTDENRIRVRFGGKAHITLLDGDRVLSQGDFAGEAVFTVENPKLWNAERPCLYTLRFCCGGEVITQKVGFRTIGISARQEFLINGTPVKLQGVNHHDTHPTNGWTMTDAEILQDLRLMKALNINCIRTSHYPPTPKFLEYCDEMGFYVVLETDLESHGFSRRFGSGESHPGYDMESTDWPGRRPEWAKEHLERMVRAVERDKNHPSIVMWSNGNECGHGENHKAMLRWAKERDKTRPVHSENACRKAWQSGHPEYRSETYDSDVHSRMYLSVDACRAYCQDPANDQPLFLCEYAHAMGNGPGDVYDYWELADQYPNFIGGCIWEWADHTVMEDGVAKYGGDWPSELTHDGNFCCDGMVFPDRSFKAGTYEIKAAYQPIRAELAEGTLRIRNRYAFTNLRDHELTLELVRDGAVLAQTSLHLDLDPGKTGEMALPWELPEICSLGCCVNVRLKDPSGAELAFSQVALPVPVQKAERALQPLLLTETDKEIFAQGEGFSYVFSKRYGTLVSMKIRGREQLAAPVRLSAFRAPTDNERKVRGYWIKESSAPTENIDKTFCKTYSCRVEGNAVVTEGSLAGVSVQPYLRYTQWITVGADGTLDIQVEAAVNPRSFWLQRFGYSIRLCDPDAPFTYYGMGPGETYADLHHYAGYGLWQSRASAEYVPYIKPQEHGNHIGVRYLSFEDFAVVADAPFECNVSQYSPHTLWHTRHAAELTKDGVTHLRIDYKNSGIGSGSCGPELMPQYRLAEKDIRFRFQIQLK